MPRRIDSNEAKRIRALRTIEPLALRFWRNVAVRSTNECWLWVGAIRYDGYGVIGLGTRQDGLARSHRLAWELTVGPIPKGLFVCHHCDNPTCCNPNHLFIGTARDNHQDMRRKGRHVNPPVHWGADNPRSKARKGV